MAIGDDDEDLFDEAAWARSRGFRDTGGINQEGPGGVSDFDRTSADIPIWGWLSGASARRDAAEGDREARRNEEMWNQLAGYMPSADDLAVDYAMEDYIGGGDSEWLGESDEDALGGRAMEDSLASLTEWSRGGFTDTDRAMMDENARMEALRARGDREAALSALEARGMGGSGMDLMARMGADEAAAGRSSAANTSLLAAAQQRAYNAAGALGAAGERVATSDDARRDRLDAWGARETDYARSLEGRNTGRENETRESRANANQGAYENRERAVAGATNQYSTDVGRRAAEGRREDESDQALGGLVGTILENI